MRLMIGQELGWSPTSIPALVDEERLHPAAWKIQTLVQQILSRPSLAETEGARRCLRLLSGRNPPRNQYAMVCQLPLAQRAFHRCRADCRPELLSGYHHRL